MVIFGPGYIRLAMHLRPPVVFFLLLLTVFLHGPYAHAQYAKEPVVLKHVHRLASDKMKGRGTGSRELERAARYIEKHFKKYRLQPLGTEGYRQAFTATVRRVTVADSIRKADNIIGFLDNGAPHTIIVGAHYDHLGTGQQGGSLDSLPQGKIHNGADDNASGVAGLLELARHFSQNGRKEPYNFLFIAFAAEELGLQGSRHFTDHPTLPLEQVHFMLNMDMIGRYHPERGIGIGGYGTSPAWPEVFSAVETDIKFFTDNAGSGGSDHHVFYRKGIPVLFFHTGGHPDYHRPGDDPDKINYPALAGIIDLEIQLIEHAMKQGKLTFSPTD